jgi:starch phosphorylase
MRLRPRIASRSSGAEVSVGEQIEVEARVRLGDLRPEDVVVELYYGPTMGSHELLHGSLARRRVTSANADGTHTFAGGIPTHESGSHAFAARVMPWNQAMSHPYETSLVRWA